MSDDRHDPQSNDLEQRLRAALRPVDPGEGFAAGVLARVAAAPPRRSRSPAVASWLAFGLAASLVLAVLLAHEWQVRRIEQGREARRQLIEALRVTNEKLDLAYRAVNSREGAAPAPQEHSGA